jgi:cob(I)alamin adenosyltransferase
MRDYLGHGECFALQKLSNHATRELEVGFGMIYTRNGDDGRTTLHGVRVSKASLQCELLGSLDEINSLMGLCKIKARGNAIIVPPNIPLHEVFEEIQQVLFVLQATTAGYNQPMDETVVKSLESYIAAIESHVSMPQHFVLAGGTELAAFFDYVRTVVRRVERVFVHYLEQQSLESNCGLIFLNRLSSFMYVCARLVNSEALQPEIKPCYTVGKPTQ